MATVDEFLAMGGVGTVRAAADRYAFEIDADMRVVQVPSDAAVLGVEGDRNTNRVAFFLPREYRGTDLSEFDVQVSYVNAGGELGVYDAGKPTVEADGLSFDWLVEEPVVRYQGAVRFAAKLYQADERGAITRQYSTTVGTATCLEGLDVDAELPEDVTKSLLAQLTGLTEASAKRANEAASRAEAAADGANEAASRAAGNILRAEASGALCHADDAFRAKPLGLTVYGASKQDGEPSPSSPAPIASVSKAPVRMCGRNVFAGVPSKTAGGVKFSAGEDGAVRVTGTPSKQYASSGRAIAAPLQGGKITVSCSGNVGASADAPGAVYPQVTIENAEGANTNRGLYEGMGSVTVDVPRDARGVVVAVSCGTDTVTPRDATLRVVAQAGESADAAYEPYAELGVALDLAGHELRSLPNGVRDEVRIDALGNVELVKRTWKLQKRIGDMNNAEDYPGWELSFDEMEPPVEDGADVKAEGISSHFGNFYIRYISGLSYWLIYVMNVGMTQSELVARYPDEVVTLVGELATPEVVPLGAVELPTLPAPVLNAWVESDVPTECAVRYVRDANVVIGRLEEKLAAVASAAMEER